MPHHCSVDIFLREAWTVVATKQSGQASLSEPVTSLLC